MRAPGSQGHVGILKLSGHRLPVLDQSSRSGTNSSWFLASPTGLLDLLSHPYFPTKGSPCFQVQFSEPPSCLQEFGGPKLSFPSALPLSPSFQTGRQCFCQKSSLRKFTCCLLFLLGFTPLDKTTPIHLFEKSPSLAWVSAFVSQLTMNLSFLESLKLD